MLPRRPPETCPLRISSFACSCGQFKENIQKTPSWAASTCFLCLCCFPPPLPFFSFGPLDLNKYGVSKKINKSHTWIFYKYWDLRGGVAGGNPKISSGLIDPKRKIPREKITWIPLNLLQELSWWSHHNILRQISLLLVAPLLNLWGKRSSEETTPKQKRSEALN